MIYHSCRDFDRLVDQVPGGQNPEDSLGLKIDAGCPRGLRGDTTLAACQEEVAAMDARLAGGASNSASPGSYGLPDVGRVIQRAEEE